MNQSANANMPSLTDWHDLIRKTEQSINQTILGQETIVRQMMIATLSRGHVLLEGDVGVGKTTLLKTVAETLGGNFERIEGTIDLMPHDLVYYTYITENGKPGVSPGPVLKHGDALSIFFFNEINRARPQVHSLLLRIMAERSVHAFNQTHYFPHLQVFADRNRIEKDETFELPAAARDRFMMELHVEQPKTEAQLKDLMFNPRFHDAEKLVDSAEKSILPYQHLNDIAVQIQQQVKASAALQDYGFHLCRALRDPDEYAIQISDVDVSKLIKGGMGPRGISYLARGARVNAWLNQREAIIPEDFHVIIKQVAKHRLFLNPVYDYNRDQIVDTLIETALDTVASP
jgi:MoxR-like ATPase